MTVVPLSSLPNGDVLTCRLNPCSPEPHGSRPVGYAVWQDTLRVATIAFIQPDMPHRISAATISNCGAWFTGAGVIHPLESFTNRLETGFCFQPCRKDLGHAPGLSWSTSRNEWGIAVKNFTDAAKAMSTQVAK